MPTIEAVTTTALGLALDAATLRQRAIASNIANLNTVGYVPLQVNFAQQVEQAQRSLKMHGQIDASALANIDFRLEAVPEQAGQTLALDQVAAQQAQNAAHYQALVRALNKHFALLSFAVNDGKR